MGPPQPIPQLSPEMEQYFKMFKNSYLDNALRRAWIFPISRCYRAHPLTTYALFIISNLGIILELKKFFVPEETEHHNVNHFRIGII
jgi:hypothetical protein